MLNGKLSPGSSVETIAEVLRVRVEDVITPFFTVAEAKQVYTKERTLHMFKRFCIHTQNEKDAVLSSFFFFPFRIWQC